MGKITQRARQVSKMVRHPVRARRAYRSAKEMQALKSIKGYFGVRTYAEARHKLELFVLHKFNAKIRRKPLAKRDAFAKKLTRQLLKRMTEYPELNLSQNVSAMIEI